MKEFTPRFATELDREIGARIRARRDQLGITQRDLAAMVGLSFQQMQKYEVGDNRVSANLLVHVAHVLRTDPVALLPTKSRKKLAPPPRNDPLAVQLMDAFSRISSQAERRLLVNMARRLMRKQIEDQAPAKVTRKKRR